MPFKPALAVALLACGCSSRDEPAGSEPPSRELSERAPQPRTEPASPPASSLETSDCNGGKVDACHRAGLLDVACLHGDAEACVEQSEKDVQRRERWLERACRRGASASCKKGAVALALELESSGDGPAGERVASVYQHSVADCYAEIEGAKASVSVQLTYGPEGLATVVAASTDDKLRVCVQQQAAGWAFPDTELAGKAYRFGFSVAARAKEVAHADDEVARITEAIGEEHVALLGVIGEGADRNQDRGADLDKAIADVKEGVGVVGSKEGRGTGTGVGRGPLIAKRDEPRNTVEQAAKSRITIGNVEELGDGTLDSIAVSRTIRSRYLRGIKSCHERALTVDQRSAGRVQLRFAVGTTGRVTTASVKGFDPTVDSCIERVMTNWRFAAPKNTDGGPTTASFALQLVAKPERTNK